jgi:hypothetical protein
VPAPAVIPAPRAYINAVAVKGFVVELGVVKETLRPSQLGSGHCSCNSRTSETIPRDWYPSDFACNACGWAPVIITVTKEA